MHQWVLWVLVAASALHVVEERALGWQGWAKGVLGKAFGLAPSWADFWATNAALIVFGIAAASVGWKAPAFSLALPALCIINAVAFHIVPSIREGRPNPGVFTASALYVPIGIWAYAAASADNRLSAGTLLGSLLIGAAVMAAAILILILGQRFGYDDDPAPAMGPPPPPIPPH